MLNILRSTSFVHWTPSTTATTNLSIKRKRHPRRFRLPPPATTAAAAAGEHLHQDRASERGAAGDQPQVPSDRLLYHLHRVVLKVGVGGRHARGGDRRLHPLVRDR